jgi:hypothetical protein
MVSALKYETKVVARQRTIHPRIGWNEIAPEKELHFENGLFLNRVNSDGEPQLARLFSVPHGDSIFAIGNFRIAERDNGTHKIRFPVSDGSVPALFGALGQDFFDNPELHKMAPSMETDETATGFLPKGTVASQNMQKALEAETGNAKVIAAFELHFDTDLEDGSVQNITFIDREAPTDRLKANYWIQRVRPEFGAADGSEDFAQLQYAQIIDIKFNGFTWPHVIVNTLVRGAQQSRKRVPWEDYGVSQTKHNWFKARIDAMSLEKLKAELNVITNDNPAELREIHHDNFFLENYVIERIDGTLGQKPNAITREGLEQEFKNCNEAKKLGASSDHDFVTSLYWRYWGEAPDASLENNVDRLRGTGALKIEHHELEEEFRLSPNSVAHFAQTSSADSANNHDVVPTDHDFTVSLYWRYLKHAPDGNLEHHTERLI